MAEGQREVFLSSSPADAYAAALRSAEEIGKVREADESSGTIYARVFVPTWLRSAGLRISILPHETGNGSVVKAQCSLMGVQALGGPVVQRSLDRFFRTLAGSPRS